MGSLSKAKMFNRKAGRKQSKASEILKNLRLRPGQTVADIGSGGGFFAFLFSYEVGEKGTVYAVDIDRDFLDYIEKQAVDKGRENIRTILASETAVPLPRRAVDLVFVRNVYHHLTNRIQYFAEVREVLCPKGRVVIIEYNRQGSRWSFHYRCGHSVPKDVIIDEMAKAGYTVAASFDFLPVQSFLIFTPE
jgi:arsenite methyltransferase